MGTLKDLALALWATVLPDPERSELAPRTGIDVPLWSFAVGLVECLGGGVFLILDGLSYLERKVAENSALFYETATPAQLSDSEIMLAQNWSGAVAWLQWLLEPFTWLLIVVALTGMVRLVAYGVSREAVGEPWVWAGLRLYQAIGRLSDRSTHKARFGRARPDRFVREEGSDLVLLTGCRQEGWNEAVTIKVEERFYRLIDVEERRDGAWWVYAYRLREDDAHGLIRALVHYRPDPKAEIQREPAAP